MSGLILRSGLDLLEIERLRAALDRHAERFLQRVFTERELAECQGNVRSLAARFAAKEAVAKALGTVIGDVGWLEIEVQRGVRGEPVLALYGKAEALAAELGLQSWTISLTHTQTTAAAMAIAVGVFNPKHDTPLI